jgi:hypothetical protein
VKRKLQDGRTCRFPSPTVRLLGWGLENCMECLFIELSATGHVRKRICRVIGCVLRRCDRVDSVAKVIHHPR